MIWSSIHTCCFEQFDHAVIMNFYFWLYALFFLHLVWSSTSGVRALHLLCQTQFECGVFWCSILCGGAQQWNGSLLQPSAVKSCSCAAVGAFWAHCPVLLRLALFSPALLQSVAQPRPAWIQRALSNKGGVSRKSMLSKTTFLNLLPHLIPLGGPLTVFCSAFRLKYCLCLVLFFSKKKMQQLFSKKYPEKAAMRYTG